MKKSTHKSFQEISTSGTPKIPPEMPDACQVAEVLAPDTTDNAIRGSFDGLDGVFVMGWARDESNGDSPVQLDVLADESWVASGTADLYRGDLHDAGIGKGMHAFKIRLPAVLCDGQSYQIRVRTIEGGVVLPPGPHEFQQSATVIGQIDGLDGATIYGWVRDLKRPDETVSVELLIDGKPVSTSVAAERIGAGWRFGLRVSPEYMDGLPHEIAVQVKEPFFLLGQTAVILPAILTPTDVLRQYATFFDKSSILDGAAGRYESLRRQINALTAVGSTLSLEERIGRLRQVAQAHEQVILGINLAERTASALAKLKFPTVNAPDVSVIIPVHNKVLVTFNCLSSLLLAYNHASFEVIIVDDGSTDETVELPDLIESAHFVRHEEAQGFVRSCNDGAKLARGRYICMLNNDTEVTSGWLDELIHVFDHFQGVGLVGSKLLYSNGKLQEAGGIVWSNGDPWNYGRGANSSEPRFNYTRQVDYLSGASVLLPKTLWEQLGGFDEHFAPAYFEDADIAFRIRELGYKTVYAPFSEVIHFEGVSSGTSVASGMKRFQEVNRPKFKGRWSRAFKNNGAIGRDPDIQKDRNVRFRALVIDFATPQPDRDAGSYAAVQEMRLLQSLGFKVTFIPDNLAYIANATEHLQRMGVECIYAPFVLSVAELIQKRGGEFDLVYITRYSIAARHIESIRKYAPQAKVIFNNADLHFLRELRIAISSKRPDDMARALATRDDELALMRKVDLVLSYSEAEHAVIVSHNLDSTKVARCPWVVEIPAEIPAFEERNGIAFVGGFTHSPNIDAMEYFVSEVMPLVRNRLPGVTLKIYGSGMSERTLKLQAEDVLIMGWVKNIADVYASCRVFVAPLRSGAGLKGKVIGAFAHGTPCVLSAVASEGTGVRHAEEVFIANTPEQWVSNIEQLYKNKITWLAMQRAALKYTRQDYSFARGQELMRSALEAVDIYAMPESGSLISHLSSTDR